MNWIQDMKNYDMKSYNELKLDKLFFKDANKRLFRCLRGLGSNSSKSKITMYLFKKINV